MYCSITLLLFFPYWVSLHDTQYSSTDTLLIHFGDRSLCFFLWAEFHISISLWLASLIFYKSHFSDLAILCKKCLQLSICRLEAKIVDKYSPVIILALAGGLRNSDWTLIPHDLHMMKSEGFVSCLFLFEVHICKSFRHSFYIAHDSHLIFVFFCFLENSVDDIWETFFCQLFR